MNSVDNQERGDHCEIDRRNSARNIQSIADDIHQLDKRVAVLESRINSQDSRLSRIELDTTSVKNMTEKIFDTLIQHINQENADKQKIMAWLIVTLVSVMGFGITTFLRIFFKV